METEIRTVKEFLEVMSKIKSNVRNNKHSIDIIDDGVPSHPYRIAKNRCNTEGKILDWILHLSGKKWITTQMIYDFAELAMEESGIKREYSS
jgi:hypothetical protein